MRGSGFGLVLCVRGHGQPTLGSSLLLNVIGGAVQLGEKQPDRWIDDPGFALTQGNMATKEMDMWGCKLYHNK